ncbi:MAG: hypothetical protein EU547_00770 [Promethearchaeota archaeon]|nr:MAG: hypothetical protein EU547_00770 [Candidatus Lokiarchaeota archaeon]
MTKSKSKVPEEPWVKIKPKAYYKMLVHVLRFGSRVREQGKYKEVMGILVGHLEGKEDVEIKNVIIDDAIPISHGGSIEVQFAPEDYAKFSMIDEQLANKNLFSVGWYHSHPNLGIFFSGTDIVNQLGWQTQWNPSGIGIVFDHTYLDNENDLGFRTFRLDDPSKGTSSGYHEVHTIVEPPNSISFYENIINLIHSVQTKEPPILERNEKLDLLGAVRFPKEDHLIPSSSGLNSKAILSSMKEGIISLIENLTQPIITHFNDWSDELIQKTGNLNISMRNNLIEVKDTMNSEIDQIKESVKDSLTKNLNSLDDGIYVKIENLIKKYNEVKKLFDEFKERLEISTEKKLDDVLENNLKDYKILIKEVQKTLQNAEKIDGEILNIIDSNSEELNSLNNVIKEAQNESLTQIQTLQEQENEEFQKNIQSIQEQISTINQRISKFKAQLKDSIVAFEESKTHLQEKIKQLKDKKSELQEKLNEEKEKKIELQDELHKVKEIKMELQNNLNDVKEEKINLQNELNTMNEKNIELENSISKIQEENKKLKSQLENEKTEG